jgi:hypothetical protein
MVEALEWRFNRGQFRGLCFTVLERFMTPHAVWTRAILAFASVLLLGAVRAAPAQGWTLALFVDPFPSPYASDWETNPNISSLTIASPAGAAQDVRLVYQVADAKGRILASGSSDPLGIPPGAPTVLTSIIDIAGSSRRDQTLWDQMQRTGRIPEGTYRACVVMAGTTNLVLGEDCDSFTIVYPDAPQLIAPAPGDVITTIAPFFQWTPVIVPPAYPVKYVLQIAEVLPNQTAEEALHAGIAHYQQPDLTVTNVQYPPNGQPFEPGKRYAWRVVAIDEHGFSPTANGGLSEIRTFSFDDQGTNRGVSSAISLTLSNDFDADPSGNRPLYSPQDGSMIEVNQLCASWHQPIKGVRITSASPLGLKRFTNMPAVFWRDSTAMKWWIATSSLSGRSVLVGGDCLTFKADGTRIRWIASRDSSLQRNIGALLSATTNVDSLWGIVVMARGKETVEVPENFEAGQQFLRGRTLDVAPGLNVLTVLNMKEWGLWPLMQRIGYTEKEIEVKGFLGWDATWHIGGAVGDKAGVDLSTERKFLVLEASLPKRKPVLDFFKKGFESSQISFELSVGDSTGRGFTLAKDPTDSSKRDNVSSYSFDLVGKMNVTFTINEDLALVGSVGFDVARETDKPIGRDLLSRAEWLRGAAGYGKATQADTRSAWIARHLSPEELDPPEVNTDIVFGLGLEGKVATLLGDADNGLQLDGVTLDFKYRKPDSTLTVMVAATAGLAGIEGLFKVGASYKWDWKKEKPDTVALKREIAELDDRLETLSMPLPDCFVSASKEVSACKTVLDLRKKRKQLKDERFPDGAWRIRVSAGHVPLGQVLDLLKPLIR